MPCHVFAGLSEYRATIIINRHGVAYPQPLIGGDDDVADQINPGPHPKSGPTGGELPDHKDTIRPALGGEVGRQPDVFGVRR